MQIYLFQNEQQSGPYSVDQIQEHLVSGQITPETLSWYEGLAEWVPIASIVKWAPPVSKTPPEPKIAPAVPQRATVEPQTKSGSPANSNVTVVGNATVRKALKYVTSILVANEMVEAWAIQRRLHGLSHRRAVVVVTTGRFIVLKRGLFGGFKMGDIRWQDMQDSKIQVGIFSASIKVTFAGIADMSLWSVGAGTALVGGLEKEQAQAVYRIGQAQDQAWREKRRIRDMEEMRAKAGGYQMPMSHENNSGHNDSVARLQQAKQMLEARLVPLPLLSKLRHRLAVHLDRGNRTESVFHPY